MDRIILFHINLDVKGYNALGHTKGTVQTNQWKTCTLLENIIFWIIIWEFDDIKNFIISGS